MLILEPYDQLDTSEKTHIIVRSGREAGKSKHIAQKIIKDIIGNIQKDHLITRASYSDLKDSLFGELLVIIDELNLRSLFTIKNYPLHIRCNLTRSNIHFKGIGGADFDRTKGFKPPNPLMNIVIDELQQMNDEASLNQALASFRRAMHIDGAKVIIAFNPPPMNSHWVNEFYRMLKQNPDYLRIETSYKDIAGILNRESLRAIEMMRILNFKQYEYQYLAVTNGLFGGVYYTFKSEKHFINKTVAKGLIKKYGIHSLIIGVDGATTRDSTAFVPMLVLRNGQTMVVERFFHNPKQDGALSNEQLMPMVKRWVDDIIRSNDIQWNVPIYFICDPASADLKQTLIWHFGTRYTTLGYNQKNIVKMAQVMQNCFSKNVTYIVDYDGYYNYYHNYFERSEAPLVRQLESVIWAETGDKFDPTVPNDLTDALTYAVNWYFNTPENIYMPHQLEYYSEINTTY